MQYKTIFVFGNSDCARVNDFDITNISWIWFIVGALEEHKMYVGQCRHYFFLYCFQCNHISIISACTYQTKSLSSMCCSLCWKYVDLKAVNSLQELPVDLAVNVPSQTPNWDIVCDIVNLTSKTFRSARQVNSCATKSRTSSTVHGSLTIQPQRNTWHFFAQITCTQLSIIKRILHGRLEVRNFSSHVENYFTHSLHSVVKYFLILM